MCNKGCCFFWFHRHSLFTEIDYYFSLLLRFILYILTSVGFLGSAVMKLEQEVHKKLKTVGQPNDAMSTYIALTKADIMLSEY